MDKLSKWQDELDDLNLKATYSWVTAKDMDRVKALKKLISNHLNNNQM